MTDRELIQRHIEHHPYHPGPAHTRLVDSGVDVWIIVASADSVSGDLDQVADTFGVSHEAVQAACAYYSKHKELIDARIALEHAAFSRSLVADLYADQGIARATAMLLREAGRSVTRSQEVGRSRAADVEQLLFAAEHEWIFLTHDRDFIDLHLTWLRWPAAWNVTRSHAGILIIPPESLWPPPQAVQYVDAMIREVPQLSNRC
jgi:uncharacterized protein (DUF433 family)